MTKMSSVANLVGIGDFAQNIMMDGFEHNQLLYLSVSPDFTALKKMEQGTWVMSTLTLDNKSCFGFQSNMDFKINGRGGRSFLKIHFFIESGIKMFLFKIQCKTKSKIFIQKYSFN